MSTRRNLPRQFHWLLAFLTVVASFMHLTRLPEMGGLGVMSFMTGQVATAPQTVEAQAHAGHAQHVAPPKPLKMDCLPGHEQHDPATAPDLTSAAPNAPPAHSGHDSAAHCPFCLTPAFALEAVGFSLPFVGALTHRWAGLTWVAPALKLVRHAEARAPPQPSA